MQRLLSKKFLAGFVSLLSLLISTTLLSSILPLVTRQANNQPDKTVLAATTQVYVSGTVYNANYIPISNAYVRIYNADVSYEQHTNSNGGFAFIVPGGGKSYSLYAWANGYKANTQYLTAHSNPINTFFALQPVSPPNNTSSGNNSGGTQSRPTATPTRKPPTPTPGAKAISGRVFIVNSSGEISGRYAGARVNLHNNVSGTNAHVETDSAGYYSFSSYSKNLAKGRQTYIVSLVVPKNYIPVSETSFTRTLNDGDKVMVDFKIRRLEGTGGGIAITPVASSTKSPAPKPSATPTTILLTVKVTDAVSDPVSGASITVCKAGAVGDGTGITVPCAKGQTNSSGSVTMPIPANSKLRVYVAKGSLETEDIVYTKTENKTVTIPLFKQTVSTSIAGGIQIVNDKGELLGIYDEEEVTVTLSGDGNATTTTYSGDGVTGWYDFENLKPGATYTVTLDDVPGYKALENPISNIKTVLNAKIYKHFRIIKISGSTRTSSSPTPTPKISDFVIKGKVLDENDRPLENIPVHAVRKVIGGTAQHSDHTDAKGIYMIILKEADTYKVRALPLSTSPYESKEAPSVTFERGKPETVTRNFHLTRKATSSGSSGTSTTSPSIQPTSNNQIVGQVWIKTAAGLEKYREGRIRITATNVDGQNRHATFNSDGSYQIYPLIRDKYTITIKLPSDLRLVSRNSISVTFSGNKIQTVDFTIEKK